MKHFKLYDKRDDDRDIEQAHKRLAALYPGATWRYSRATERGCATFIAFSEFDGLVAYAEIDTDVPGLCVHAMAEADVQLYELGALLFAREIGARLHLRARDGERVSLAPRRVVCEESVQSGWTIRRQQSPSDTGDGDRIDETDTSGGDQ